MMPGGERSGKETPGDSSGPRRRALHEDLAILLLAVAVLVVPALSRSTPAGPLRIDAEAVKPVRIDINLAPWYEWMLLDGVGEARAKGIVEHRASHGPFRSINDLARVPRMPAGWVERVRPYLEVGE